MATMTHRHKDPAQLAAMPYRAPRKGDLPLDAQRVHDLLESLEGWESHDGKTIFRRYDFEDFYETMAFVNALAWIANRANHHPDLEVSYNQCTVHFSTHDVGGLSEADFICAARVEQLMRPV